MPQSDAEAAFSPPFGEVNSPLQPQPETLRHFVVVRHLVAVRSGSAREFGKVLSLFAFFT